MRSTFNGDANGDLAIGEPGQDGGAGVVIVAYGTAEGLSYQVRQIIDQTWAGGTHEADDRFGSSLAAGNFDGDQWSDLAVGSSACTPGAPRHRRREERQE